MDHHGKAFGIDLCRQHLGAGGGEVQPHDATSMAQRQLAILAHQPHSFTEVAERACQIVGLLCGGDQHREASVRHRLISQAMALVVGFLDVLRLRRWRSAAAGSPRWGRAIWTVCTPATSMISRRRCQGSAFNRTARPTIWWQSAAWPPPPRNWAAQWRYTSTTCRSGPVRSSASARKASTSTCSIWTAWRC